MREMSKEFPVTAILFLGAHLLLCLGVVYLPPLVNLLLGVESSGGIISMEPYFYWWATGASVIMGIVFFSIGESEYETNTVPMGTWSLVCFLASLECTFYPYLFGEEIIPWLLALVVTVVVAIVGVVLWAEAFRQAREETWNFLTYIIGMSTIAVSQIFWGCTEVIAVLVCTVLGIGGILLVWGISKGIEKIQHTKREF